MEVSSSSEDYQNTGQLGLPLCISCPTCGFNPFSLTIVSSPILGNWFGQWFWPLSLSIISYKLLKEHLFLLYVASLVWLSGVRMFSLIFVRQEMGDLDGGKGSCIYNNNNDNNNFLVWDRKHSGAFSIISKLHIDNDK
ncbi:hypothetical protein XELAEV_18030579mg [Xenopus laevis]|uniref:Transmembrane protein n=1 Tax=Xenopus laevis TaxID=8355 RepID=A0A974CL39_XENLA|nr:hypothetical protein XELAEV_18030579mg [Xenopus laevis]